MKKITQVIPAAPGTIVVWFNHCWQRTTAEPVVFWGLGREDDCEFVVPFVFNDHGGFATELEMPERDFPEDDPRHDGVSSILAYEIPGWGRMQLATEEGPKHETVVDGFVADLVWRKGGAK